MRDDIVAFIQRLLVERYKVPPEEVSPDATYEAMDLDSLALLEIVLSVQKEFGLAIRQNCVTDQQTVTLSVMSMTDTAA